MSDSIPAWAQDDFGEHAAEVRNAVLSALRTTGKTMLEVKAVANSRRNFAPAGARMTNQFERLTQHLEALDLPETELVKTGTWYELALVMNRLFYPVWIEGVDREPGDQWPKKSLSGVVRELFAVTDSGRPRWVEDPLLGLDVPELVVRRSLAELAGRDPRPRLVLVMYETDHGGLHRAWWGQAELVDESGALRWLAEPELLSSDGTATLASVPQQRDEDRFDAGAPPEVPMAERSAHERGLDITPQTEKPEPTEDDATASEED
ncbi:hypothetical protein [Streptacidiphilus albus]|uniref:hypothetical protein n=1 Tax=Streptacidiphilus albus TaxID=105425 RepID=UPI00054BD07F|nr:hypothetical protein [Streptacidiphilus albus]